MRRLSPYLVVTLFALTVAVHAQQFTVPWLVEDFATPELKASWLPVGGSWAVNDEKAVPGGSAEQYALCNSAFFLRTQPYMIDMTVRGAGAGLVFALEDPTRLACGHVVLFTGSMISTGFFDFQGKYVESRTVEFIMPSTAVSLRVRVDPVKRRYEVFVQNQSVSLMDMRFLSGHVALYSRAAGAMFDNIYINGGEAQKTPSFYLKSNARQIDHLSYFGMLDESLLLPNPVVGMVQRVSSVGSYISEIPVQGQNARPRGVCADDDRWVYVVDGGQQSVRIYNNANQLERIVSTDMKDPRGVAVITGTMYVLDAEGIKCFDKKGNFLGAKCAGLFKDPKNLFAYNGLLYVADFGNGQIQVLDKNDLTVRSVIREQLVSPYDVCVDDLTQDVFVADPGASAVFHFKPDGSFVERIDPITINGFISPRAVRVRHSMIYVADFERILGFKKEAGLLSIRPAFRTDKDQ
jgi:hypothetical protein